MPFAVEVVRQSINVDSGLELKFKNQNLSVKEFFPTLHCVD